MHELSIATGVMETVIKSAKQNGAKAVKSVDICVGTSTAIIEEAIVEAFRALSSLAENMMCKNAQFNIESVPSTSICLDCGEKYTHGAGAAQCPKCMSYKTEILEGSDIYIKQIEVEMPD